MNVKRLVPLTVKNYIRSNDYLLRLVEFAMNPLSEFREIGLNIDIQAMLTFGERKLLYELAKAVPRPSNIVEIGTYAGGSTYFLGKGAQQSGSQVYGIDPFDFDMERQKWEEDGSHYEVLGNKPTKRSVEKALHRKSLDGVVTLIEGFSEEVATTWDKGPIGLLWIDGNHQNALHDFTTWEPYLTNGAQVAFHDTNYPTWPTGRK